MAVGQPFVTGWEGAADADQPAPHPPRGGLPSDIERYRVEFTLWRARSPAPSGGKGPWRRHQFYPTTAGTGQPLKTRRPTISTAPMNIVDWLLQYAFDQRASDIHIEPRREKTRMRYRIDGLLHPIYEFPASVGTAIVSRIKILGRMNVAEKAQAPGWPHQTKTPDGTGRRNCASPPADGLWRKTGDADF